MRMCRLLAVYVPTNTMFTILLHAAHGIVQSRLGNLLRKSSVA
jgi:hypothetical protein